MRGFASGLSDISRSDSARNSHGGQPAPLVAGTRPPDLNGIRRILALLLSVFLIAAALPGVAADDRAAQLDALFAQLKTAAPEEEPALQLAIWHVWLAYDGTDTDVPGLLERGGTAMAKDDYAVAEAAFSAVIE